MTDDNAAYWLAVAQEEDDARFEDLYGPFDTADEWAEAAQTWSTPDGNS